MESKPVSTKQKESLVTILIDNVSVCISTKRYNQLIEWIDRYNSYQIGLEIYPPESNIHKQYAIKSKIALETLKKLKNEKSSPPLLSYTLLLNGILIYNRNLIYRISILKMDLGITPPKTNKNCK
jgi:hypothetical protein